MRRLFPLLLLLLALPASARASWAYVSVEELVRETDLIVVGTLRDASERTADGVDYGEGHIAVREVIWGKVSPGDSLLLRWSNASNMVCPRVEPQYFKGKEGIWLLTRDGEAVAADYPGRFVELSERRRVEAALARSPVVLRAEGYLVGRDAPMSFAVVYRNVSGAPREFPAAVFDAGRLRLSPGSRLGVKFRRDDDSTERKAGLAGSVVTDRDLAPVTVGARDEHRVEVSLRELLADAPEENETYEVTLEFRGWRPTNTLEFYVNSTHPRRPRAAPAPAAPQVFAVRVGPARRTWPDPLTRATMAALAAFLLFTPFRRRRAAFVAAKLARASNGVQTWQI